MKMPSARNRFSEVPRAQIPRSQLDRSAPYKTTFDAGVLVPVYVDEVLPGDTVNLRMNFFGRLATPLKPIMDNMYLDSFFFFVPNRLIWDNWQKFCGEQLAPDDPTDYTVPVMAIGDFSVGTLADYFGYPYIGASGQSYDVNALHSRAYALIWNEWFRDQNLQDPAVVDKDDGPDTYADYPVRRRGKRHDYFTSCLPWPQKGDSVVIPLGTAAPVVTSSPAAMPSLRGTTSGAVGHLQAAAGGDTVGVDIDETSGAPLFQAAETLVWDPGTTMGLEADLSNATAATINSLRQAFQIQKLLERDARGGTRYTEIVRSHFGVTSPDARLQRPEYLGGSSSPVNISPVAQTSEDGSTPQGNLAGFGTVSGQGHGFAKSFTEHGVLIGMVCVRADLTYQQGLERMFSRQTRYDFYWPALAMIGEQAVLRKEIFTTGVDLDDEIVFGYQERYAEYRYKPGKITGLFRSDVSGTLDVWHLSQDFASAPVLDDTFIQDNPPVDRVIAVPTEPHFIFDAFFKAIWARPMPVYGVPGMIDHF